jgi:hypothetical protein
VKKKAATTQRTVRHPRLSIERVTAEAQELYRIATARVAMRGVLLREYILELIRKDSKEK